MVRRNSKGWRTAFSIVLVAGLVQPVAAEAIASPGVLGGPSHEARVEAFSFDGQGTVGQPVTEEAFNFSTFAEDVRSFDDPTQGRSAEANASQNTTVDTTSEPVLTTVETQGDVSASWTDSEPTDGSNPSAEGLSEFSITFQITGGDRYFSLTGSASTTASASNDDCTTVTVESPSGDTLEVNAPSACGGPRNRTIEEDGFLTPGTYEFSVVADAPVGNPDRTGGSARASFNLDFVLGCSIVGTEANDTLTADPGSDDVICGLGGDDTITARDGNDIVIGGDGNDDIDGGNDTDTLIGGGGEDAIDGGRGRDVITGGSDNDTIDGDTSPDSIRGDDGNDSITGGGSADVIEGGPGNDDIAAGAGNDNRVDGGDGNDELRGGDGSDGSSSRVTFTGGPGADRVFGDGGGDSISGGAGADLVNGGRSSDRVLGEGGNDDLVGGSDGAIDELAGGEGDDDLRGGSGKDGLRGDAGSDTLHGGDGPDCLTGGTNGDVLAGEAGDDKFFARDNTRDRVRGGGGRDRAKIDSGLDDVVGVEDRTFQGGC